jgi:hypothetical protein
MNKKLTSKMDLFGTFYPYYIQHPSEKTTTDPLLDPFNSLSCGVESKYVGCYLGTLITRLKVISL